MPGIGVGITVGLMGSAALYVTAISPIDSPMIDGGEYSITATTTAPDGTAAICTVNGQVFDSGVTASGGSVTFTDTITAAMAGGIGTVVEVNAGGGIDTTTTTVFTAMAIGAAWISSVAYEGAASESISRVTSAALPAGSFGLVWIAGDNLASHATGASSRITSVSVGGISAVKLAEYTCLASGINNGGTLWVGWVKHTSEIALGATIAITTASGEGLDGCVVGGVEIESHADAVLVVDGEASETITSGLYGSLTATMTEDTEHILCRCAVYHRSSPAFAVGGQTVGWTLRGFDDWLPNNPTQDTGEGVCAELLYDGFDVGASDASAPTKTTVGAKTSFMFAFRQS